MIYLTNRKQTPARLVAVVLFGILTLATFETVHAAGTQRVTGEVIESKALEFLHSHLIDEDDTLEPTVRYEGSDLVLPKGKVDYDFRLPVNGLNVGRVPLSLNVKVGGKYQRRVRLEARLTAYRDVIWTRHRVKRGDILTEEDVRVETMKFDRPVRRIATRLEDVVGLEAQRTLSKGRMIPLNSLKRPPLVDKGDQVIIVAEKGMMKITAPGIVRAPGFKDSLVQVLNIQTKKMVYARVVDANTVKVNF